jgi:hypothetical protein
MRRCVLLLVALQAVICVHSLPDSSSRQVLVTKRAVGTLAGHESHFRSRIPFPENLRLRGGRSQRRVNPFDALNGMSIERQNLVGFIVVMVLVPLEVDFPSRH